MQLVLLNHNWRKQGRQYMFSPMTFVPRWLLLNIWIISADGGHHLANWTYRVIQPNQRAKFKPRNRTWISIKPTPTSIQRVVHSATYCAAETNIIFFLELKTILFYRKIGLHNFFRFYNGMLRIFFLLFGWITASHCLSHY